MHNALRYTALMTLALAGAAPAMAASPEEAAAKTLMASAKFHKAQASLEGDFDRILGDVVTLTEIPAPPFQENTRAKVFMAMLKAEGLDDVEMDAEGNVMGLHHGTGAGKLIVVTGHMDTVFPAGTNVKVRSEGDMLYAPGIGDDTCSLPVILAMIRAIKAAGYQTKSDILFMGNVGEEGPGDLRGTRYLFQKGKYKDRIGAFISLEPGMPEHIINGGTGSKRYKVTFKGPGGHSMMDFGLVNPAYAMAGAMTAFGQIKVPANPLTVYNVGIVEGGTSVNSIPFATAMTIDMRSNGKPQLDALERNFLEILPVAVAAENAARSTAKGKITFDAKQIGERPVGTTPVTARITKIASATVTASGRTPQYMAISTDSNIPMSLGVEALTLGSGFETFRGHSLEESLKVDKPANLRNFGINLATVLLLAEAK
jgi:acetylornithine deacetylase/succinyl-diaminopimelate desuccinylase-like protein